ncbi:MAG: SusD/RagB family nutrient-binding outer membrane lipoprotein [Tannerella sp.]|nr:SusD/RagB family nutrient-binding outer membrane lipoprotein [Tannerella sp.]
MKNIVSKIMLLAFVLTLSNSCSESSYDDKFLDPSKSTTVDFGNLAVGTNLYSREWAMSTYGRFFGWESQVLMKQANTVGITLDPAVFYALEGYTDGMPPLGELSKMIASYKFMESLYADMDESEKNANKVYLLAAETQLYAFTVYIVSIFGDIPFDEVGQVSVTGDVSLAHPHYQDDQEIISTILDRLGVMNGEWAAITTTPGSFSQQDFINKGDLDKWRRYNNSIRLKTALLVSTQGPLASKGQGVIGEILNNSSANPIIETAAHNVVMAQVNISGSALDINGGSGFDWTNQRIAATEIIKRMQVTGDGGVWSGEGLLTDGTPVTGQTTDDPRLPIMFCLATVNGEFAVLTKEEEAVDPETPKNGKAVPTVFRGSCAAMDPDLWAEFLYPSANRAYFSYIRVNGFFKDNRNWDNPIITSAEVKFIKAEAYERGWAAGDAKATFKEAVKESIQLYFKYQNNRSVTETSYATGSSSTSFSFKWVINPDQTVYNDAWIDAFTEARWTSRVNGETYAGGSIEAILEQKWLHYGYMYAGEQWANLRRTGYPRMYYQRDIELTAEVPFPANRNRYPESERNNNQNFQAEVGSQDNWSDVLFWARPDWHDGPTW